MVQSIANQEAIKRFIRKVNNARNALGAKNDPKPQHVHSSPFEHYCIAKSAWKRQDIIAWLGELRGDPAFEVRSQILDYCCSN